MVQPSWVRRFTCTSFPAHTCTCNVPHQSGSCVLSSGLWSCHTFIFICSTVFLTLCEDMHTVMALYVCNSSRCVNMNWHTYMCTERQIHAHTHTHVHTHTQSDTGGGEWCAEQYLQGEMSLYLFLLMLASSLATLTVNPGFFRYNCCGQNNTLIFTTIHSKPTRYSYPIHPKVIQSNGHLDTQSISRLINAMCNSLRWGHRGWWGWDKKEERLGVNGRQLLVRVDCNLEEREHVLLVQCFII